MKIDFSWLEKAAKGAFAFGKKNLPSLMTGGGIILGWSAVYIFWKESRKADKAIQEKEEALPKGEKLPTKDKVLTYLQYCWLSLVMGLGATGLEIWAHEIDISRLVEMYAVTQFLEDKNAKQGVMIDKMKGELKEKQVREIKNEIIDQEYPKEEINEHIANFDYKDGANNTLFIMRGSGRKFYGDIVKVTSGIAEFNQLLKNKRKKMIYKKLGDPFFSKSDTPYPDMSDEDAYPEVYSSLSLAVLLACIGAIDEEDKNQKIADELLEVRYYGGQDALPVNDVLFYRDYTGPGGGAPAVCYIDVTDYLSPTNELMERYPI